MGKSALSVREVRAIAERIAEEQGVELVDVELNKEPTGNYLRFFVDKGDGITLDELEVYHRRIQPLVEEVEYDFMEVSSPGADRPLKTERDFERARGLVVELKTYRPVYGKKFFRGGLIGLSGGMIQIDCDGEMLTFDPKTVAIVRPVIEFTEEDLEDEVPYH